jgi:hypothetical protein
MDCIGSNPSASHEPADPVDPVRLGTPPPAHSDRQPCSRDGESSFRRVVQERESLSERDASAKNERDRRDHAEQNGRGRRDARDKARLSSSKVITV